LSKPVRQDIIAAIDDTVAHGVPLYKACEAIGLCSRRLRRWRLREEDGRTGGYRATDQKLTAEEKAAIIAAAMAPEMQHLPVRAIHIKLLDQGLYLGSYSTFLRVFNEFFGSIVNRGARKRTRKRPELIATGPNQVWCWDITWLESGTEGKYFYLYLVMDMFSRKIVAWEVFAKEDGRFARILFAAAFAAEGVVSYQITVHADNGKPMRSCTLNRLFNRLHVTASHSRPHTSNDNAYAESLFATMKGRVLYPDFFPSIDAARDYCACFVSWYNDTHLHSSLDYVTPSAVHDGVHIEQYAKRNELLEGERLAHPSRHGGRKKVFGMETTVRLKHRVRNSGESCRERGGSVYVEKKNDSFVASEEAEAGSAGEQPTRNTLIDRDDREGGLGLAFPISMNILGTMPQKTQNKNGMNRTSNGQFA
jgi:putative transposase